jgi:uncharacterized protein (DUF433 family)
MAADRKIKAAEILYDIRSGMTEAQLMKKYGLSLETLRTTVKKLKEEREKRANEIANAVKSGMTDAHLMQKYGLSSGGLRSAFRSLRKMGLLDEATIADRTQPSDKSAFFESMREFPRHYMVIPIPISVTGENPTVTGRLRDLTEKGIGVSGIPASVDEVKMFSIMPDELVRTDPIVFEGTCRWVKKDEAAGVFAGFELTNISENCLESLKELKKEFTFGD